MFHIMLNSLILEADTGRLEGSCKEEDLIIGDLYYYVTSESVTSNLVGL